jgi:NAD+-dependent farnesol dehydrogenase
MHVLVTGGTGYLGSAIVRALARHGHAPVVFARHATSASLPGRAVDGDVRDRTALARAADGVDAICHAAALVSVTRPRPAEFDEINVGGLEAILAVAGALGTPRIIYTSSFLARAPADRTGPICANDYQRTKVRAREVALAAAAAGAPIVSLVPGVIYGPGKGTEGNLVGRLIADHLERRLPGLVGADRPWSYAYVDDVADAHVRALDRGRIGEEYLLGGENAPQMRVFEIVRELTGAPLPRRLPYALASAAARFEEARARLTGRPPLLTRGVVEILRHDWSMDSRRSIDELGYRTTLLESGLKTLLSSLSPFLPQRE